jgi:transcriptional regulator with XRE-family HTH domain
MAVAGRLRALRLRQGWTRRTLAERSGVSLGSLERFERSGKVSLERLLKLAHAVGRLHEFEGVFGAPAATSLDELERQRGGPMRKRGSV